MKQGEKEEENRGVLCHSGMGGNIAQGTDVEINHAEKLRIIQLLKQLDNWRDVIGDRKSRGKRMADFPTCVHEKTS